MDMSLYGTNSLGPELDARVSSELSEGERLLWVGQPRPGRIARQALPIVLFGVVWTGFALFWIVNASRIMSGGFGNGQEGFSAFSLFPLFGLPFVLIGVGMLSSPYWMRRHAKRTCYALTDRRALILGARWFGSVEVRSYGPEGLTKIRRMEHRDGGGDLVFEEITTIGRDNDGNQTTNTKRYGFMGIDNVREVEERLRKTLLPAGGATADA